MSGMLARAIRGHRAAVRWAAIAVLLAAVIPLAPAWSEQPRVRDYTPSTLAAIRPASPTADGAVELLHRDVRYLAKVHTAGRSRPVGTETRAALEQWIQARRMKPDVMSILGTEFAFQEAGREYWIPVLALGNEALTAPANSPVTLLLHHAGRIGAEPLVVAVVAAPGWELRDRALEQDARRERQAGVRALVETVRRCADAWRGVHPRQGYPPSLAAIGPQGDGCVDDAVVHGTPFNYRLQYRAGVPDAAGVAHIYAICAQPTDYAATQAPTLVADAEGAFPPLGVAVGDQPVPCGGAWGPAGFHIAARVTVACLIEQAAAHPAAGYPQDLRTLSAAGSGCLPAGFRPDARGGIDAPFDRMRYTPKAAAPGAPVRGFELWLQSKTSPTRFLYTDERGALRGAIGRDARPDDPLLEEENLRAEQDRERARAEVEQFRAGCEAGRTADCMEAGFRYFLLNDGRALKIWEDTCTAGVKEACLLAKSRPFQFEVFEWTFDLRRLCFRGDADGCRRLHDYVARTELKPRP